MTQENLQKVSKYRSRQFNLILYEEDKTHLMALDRIKKNYNYAMIRHNQDIDENEEIKKEHFHIVIKFDNARWNTSIAEDLGIESNYIQKCANLKSSLLYLIHFRDFDKHLYSIDEVQGPLKTDLKIFIAKEEKDENIRVREVYRWIENQPVPLSISSLSKWCYENGYWDVFRRASSIFFKILDEKNYTKDGFVPNKYYQGNDIEFAFEQLGIYDM